MERNEAKSLAISLKNKHTRADIGKILKKKGYKGACTPVAITYLMNEDRYKANKAKPKGKKYKPRTSKKGFSTEVLTPSVPDSSSNKIMIMMCDINQARELLG